MTPKTITAYATTSLEDSRPGTWHLRVVEAFTLGRIARTKGETLCKKKCRYLQDTPEMPATCSKCLEIATKIAAYVPLQEK